MDRTKKLVPMVKGIRSLTSILGKLGVGKGIFHREPTNYYGVAGNVRPRPPLSMFPIYGLGLKESKDWVERYLARND